MSAAFHFVCLCPHPFHSLPQPVPEAWHLPLLGGTRLLRRGQLEEQEEEEEEQQQQQQQEEEEEQEVANNLPFPI